MQNQFSLLKKRRFLPFFTTMFLGAFNDNVYKNAVIILLTFHTAAYTTMSISTLVNLAGGLFILPYFLFSATFGQIADKYEKSRLIRYTKILEIVIACIATVGFFMQSLFLLLLALFLLGIQSTLFSPAKYGIIPQHVKSYELVGANGLVEMGTFIAILTGTITGGLLVSIEHTGIAITSATIILIALLGYTASRFIPRAKAVDPNLKLNWNIPAQIIRNINFAREHRTVFLSILAISWFWFYGAFLLYQTPKYTKVYLGGNEHVAVLVLATFSVGIGIGSLITEKLSSRQIEIGLVPIAALAITFFTTDLYFLQHHPATILNQDVHQFLIRGHHTWIIFDLLMIGIFAGLYNVPLYALIQDRSNPKHLSRVIAANNILNALFMVGSAIFAIILLKMGFTIPQLFLAVGVMNAIVTLIIFSIVPEFVVRLMIWLAINVIYRLKVNGIENLPRKGGVIYACNHVSFVDVLVLTAVSRRPIRFLMDKRLFNTPLLKQISMFGKAIPITTGKECEETKRKAFEEADRALKQGDVIGIFPEGSITRDGKIAVFKKGIEELIRREAVPVVPMAIHGLWGSFFSRKHNGRAMSTWPRRLWSRIRLNIGEPILPKDATAERLQIAIEDLFEEVV